MKAQNEGDGALRTGDGGREIARVIAPVPVGRLPFSGFLNGDGGIRTLDTGLSPYNGLANRRLQPLGHVSRPSAARAMSMIGAGLSILPALAGCVNVGQSLARFQLNSGSSASITFRRNIAARTGVELQFCGDTWFRRRRMDAKAGSPSAPIRCRYRVCWSQDS